MINSLNKEVYMYNLIFYWGLALITGILASASVTTKKKSLRKVYSWLVTCIPSFFAAIRYSSGTDTLIIYKPVFEAIYNGYSASNVDRMEYGYLFINKIVAIFGDYFPVVLFIACAITVNCIYKGLLYYKNDLSVGIGMWSFMMLFYQLSFNAIRQMISIAIFFYAIKFIAKKKYMKSVFAILVSIMFHKMAAIYFIILILHSVFENRNKKYIRYLFYVFIFVTILNFSRVQQLLLNYGIFQYYAGSYLRTTDTGGLTIGFFIRTIPFLIPVIFLKEDIKKSKYFQLIFSFTVIGSILRLFAYVTNTYAERIAYNFLIFQVALISIYFVNIKKNRKFILVGLVLFITFLSYYDYFYLGIGETVPYITIFE